MPSLPQSFCPDCASRLEPDDVCLVCVFGEALSAGGTVEETEGLRHRFGQFAPQEPGIVGKYSLRRRLGSGGMGLIWEAEEMVTRRVVALKMIRGFVFSTEADKVRFTTEAAAAAQLDHPNIVPVYEVGELEGQPYFTMKLLGGGSLSERLREGALPVREAAGIMVKLAQAVQHAHARGVLHRDLKPGNVLFDHGGNPYITDFGLAKLLEEDQELTLSHAHIGTPHYMSPEQARGKAREVTTASDVWALGAMFHQMLTGRVPFPGSTPTEIFRSVTQEEPVSMRTVTADPDRDLETLCLRCLEKEPHRRLPGAGELAEELGRWLKGGPIHSRRVTAGERTVRWVRRYPWRVAAAAALGLTLLTGSIVSLVLWQRAERHRAAAVASAGQALQHAGAERKTGYVSTLAAALAARERHDFSRARQLLAAAPEELRGFEWGLLNQLCEGDERALFRLPGGGIPEALGQGPEPGSLAVVTQDGLLHLCGPDGKELRPARPLPVPVTADEAAAVKLNPRDYHSLLYAPGGRHFACSFRNTLQVFDAETQEVLIQADGLIQVQSAWLDERRLVFGQDVSTAVAPDLAVWIFNVQDRSLLRLPQPWTAPLAVSGDRRFIALTGREDEGVTVFRTADLADEGAFANAAPVMLWKLRTPGEANVLALSPDGKYLAALCGTQDAPSRTLEVTDTASGEALLIQGFREALTQVGFHPSGLQVAATSTDGVVRLFDFLKPIPPGWATYDDDCARAIRDPLNGNGAHSPPRRMLTRSALDGRTAFLLGHEGRGTGLLYAPDGASLFTSAADGTVRVWQPQVPSPGTRIVGTQLLQMEWHPSVSPDGSRLLYSNPGGNTFLWREGKGSISVAVDHMPLAVLPEGRLATMERRTSDIILWQETDGTVRETARIPGPGYIQGFSELLRGLVTPDGTKIAGATRGQIFVVDLQKGTTSATDDQGWETGPSRAWNIALSPDGRHLVATGCGRRARLYDPADLTKPAPPLGEFRTYDTALAFHPDGSRLYCGNEDGRVRVFLTSNWTEIPGEGWQAHKGAVTAVTVSNDTRLIATAGDTTLKLWRTDQPAGTARIELLSFTTYFPAAWLHFGRDGNGADRSLMHCEPFSSLEIWPG